MAMNLLEREHAIARGDGPSTYAPIAKAIEKMSAVESARLRRRFDIAYLVATEKLSYLKYPSICELEKKHGVDIGVAYTNEGSGRMFVHYIAETRRREIVDKINNVKFFSILLDGSTDKGNIDNEAILLIYCDTDGHDEKVHTRTVYFKLIRPTAEGLFDVIQRCLNSLGIQSVDIDNCQKLIGIGTDGASANSWIKGYN